MTSAPDTARFSEQVFPDVTSTQVRDELGDLIRRDLLGPWGGPDEYLPGNRGPRDRYLVGALGPRLDITHTPDPVAAADRLPDPELTTAGEEPSLPQLLTPQAIGGMWASSMGMSFAIGDDVDRLAVTASWGSYARERHEVDGESKYGWRRTGHEHPVEVAVDGSVRTMWLEAGVRLDVAVRPVGRRRVVRLSLLNCQDPDATPHETSWMFQTHLSVRALDGHRAVFLPIGDPQDPQTRAALDDEENHLELLYRDALRHGFGHNVATVAESRDGDRNAHRIFTDWLPTHDVPQVEAAGAAGLETSMDRLADLADGTDPARLVAAVRPLVTEYREWLTRQRARAESLARPNLQDAAMAAVERAERIADRMESGVDLLAEDAQARRAFGFTNRVMALQRRNTQAAQIRATTGLDYRAAYGRVEARGAAAASWRPFQLGFVLLNLPSLTDPAHEERRGLVDLLFFPTGGGKTEAYLGLAAYTFAMRRLQGVIGDGDDARDGRDGVAVLMRYTLRMLTAQQFQRAAALVCAAEKLRRDDPGTWGAEPFRIGLWVGQGVTPNWYRDNSRDTSEARAAGNSRTPLQVSACPWCGAALDGARDLDDDQDRRRVFIYCPEGEGRGACPFSERMSRHEGLPILTVDEYLYRMPPSLLIATVDKFAQLPWRGEAGALLGRVEQRCDRHGYRHPDMDAQTGCGTMHRAKGNLPAVRSRRVTRLRPPDLIIQDELHLISDALGTTVGLFENAIDELTTWSVRGRVAGPKIVASTATTKRATEQVRHLYARDLAMFPPQVTDSTDTFFSTEVPVTAENPGRRYLGVCAHGTRLKSVEIRLAEILLIAGQTLFDRYGAPADPYMTLVGYFNATRELAGMRRYLDDDVANRVRVNGSRRDLSNRLGTSGLLNIRELTSRIDSGHITSVLTEVAEPFDPELHTSRRRREIWREIRDAKDDKRAPRLPDGHDRYGVDVVLATSMLQVGVDVSRFGLMVVTGQPKNTAEYIQATSRVGRDRDRPGLVVTVYNWSRPRDLAHFEDFGHYHRTFYRRVEALSVTPYSRRAVDRAAAATLIGAIRQSTSDHSVNEGAQTVNLDGPVVAGIVDRVLTRAENADGDTAREYLGDKINAVLDAWRGDRTPNIRQGYTDAQKPPLRGMLKSPENNAEWTDLTVSRSMRETENEINLLVPGIDLVRRNADEPGWVFGPPVDTDDDDSMDDEHGPVPTGKGRR